MGLNVEINHLGNPRVEQEQLLQYKTLAISVLVCSPTISDSYSIPLLNFASRGTSTTFGKAQILQSFLAENLEH